MVENITTTVTATIGAKNITAVTNITTTTTITTGIIAALAGNAGMN